MIKRRQSNVDPNARAMMEAAIERYLETGDAQAHDEALRLYSAVSRYKAGCGVCEAGRKSFIAGLQAMRSGDVATGKAKLLGSFRSVRLKLDSLFGG